MMGRIGEALRVLALVGLIVLTVLAIVLLVGVPFIFAALVWILLSPADFWQKLITFIVSLVVFLITAVVVWGNL